MAGKKRVGEADWRSRMIVRIDRLPDPRRSAYCMQARFRKRCEKYDMVLWCLRGWVLEARVAEGVPQYRNSGRQSSEPWSYSLVV